MNVTAVLEPGRSACFAEDLNVLGGFSDSYGFEAPIVRFGDDVWDFRAVPDRPAWVVANHFIVRFDRIRQVRWRSTVKELLCARLYPTHPAVAAIPHHRRRPAPLGDVTTRLLLYRQWLDWLDKHGVTSLNEVRQEHCDRYLMTRSREISLGAISNQVFIPLREFADYDAILTDRYTPGFRPWGHKHAAHVTGYRGRRVNATPAIPPQVLDPLLAGSLFFVETASTDILAARAEHRQLWEPLQPRGGSTRITTENLERLADALDEYRLESRPLPLLRDARATPLDDPLAPINIRLIGRHARVRLGLTTITNQQRELLLGALRDVGAAPGGLHTAITEVTPLGPDKAQGPWRDPIAPWELQYLTARLIGACFCTIAALSAMRYSEIVEIRPGSIEPLDDGISVIRWRLHSKLIKGQRHGGRRDSWQVIEPVVHAIEILERLHTNGPDDPLLTADLSRTVPRKPGHPTRRIGTTTLLRDLITWQNTDGARAGLASIPDVDGRPWPITTRQFRRTLAREIAFRPHGTIASKIQLKHLRANVTEGYWGPAGDSAERFIDELDREDLAAREERARQRFDEWDQGQPIAGGARHRLQQQFATIAQDLDSFQGTLDEREQRLRKLLRTNAGNLHFGVLNDCHFTDPSQARCLRHLPPEARTGPLIAACQPARCANASIHHDHLPGWRAVIAHTDELLNDPVISHKVPRHERERIAQQRDEHAAVITAFQADA